MRKGILDVTLYEGFEKELMIGSLCSLAGSAIWLLIATALKLPISGTHSIVGATVGFSLVCRGTAGVSVYFNYTKSISIYYCINFKNNFTINSGKMDSFS